MVCLGFRLITGYYMHVVDPVGREIVINLCVNRKDSWAAMLDFVGW